MLRFIYIFVIVFLSSISFNASAQADTVIYFWKDWKSTSIGEKKMSGVVVIAQDSIVTTYVHDYGYINWTIDKHFLNDEYIMYHEGRKDTCYMKIAGNHIFLQYTFKENDIVLHDYITLTFTFKTYDRLLFENKR